MRSKWIAACLLACTVAGAARADDQPVKLAYTLKKGAVTRIKAESESSGASGQGATVTLTVKSTVKDVKDNGDIVLLIEDEGGKVEFGNGEMEIQPGPPETLTFDKCGKLIDFKMPESEGGRYSPEVTRLLEILRMPILPTNAVKAGDSWTTELDNPAAKGKKVTIKGAFVGTEKVDGVEMWKVKQSAAPETEAGPMPYEATFWLDPATGLAAKSEAKAKDVPTVRYGARSMVSKTTRLK